MKSNILETGVFRPVVFGNIRRIIVGGLSNEFSFQVDQILYKSGVIITKIERDENAQFIFGSVMYLVYAKRIKDGENASEELWKTISGFPVITEYFV